MRITVKIANPPIGHRDETSLEHALRYVRKERAVLDRAAMVLTFLDTAMQAAILEDARKAAHAKLTGVCYDRVDREFFEHARALPMVNPAKMIREERSSRNWSFRAGVFPRGKRPQYAGASR